MYEIGEKYGHTLATISVNFSKTGLSSGSHAEVKAVKVKPSKAKPEPKKGPKPSTSECLRGCIPGPERA